MEATSKLIKLDKLTGYLWLHTAKDPSLDEWNDNIKDIRAYYAAQKGDLSNLRVLVVSDGGKPDVVQRNLLFHEIYRDQSVKTAAVILSLSNPIVRGVATAITWFNRGLKTFAPHQGRAALDYLDLSPFRAQIAAELDQLQKSLPPVAALKTFRANP